MEPELPGSKVYVDSSAWAYDVRSNFVVSPLLSLLLGECLRSTVREAGLMKCLC